MAKLTDQQRQAIITELCTNSDGWKQQGDREILNGFSDDKLLLLQDDHAKKSQAVAVANAACTGFTHEGNEYRINHKTGKWEMRTVANAKSKAPSDDYDEEDEDGEEEMAENRKAKGKKQMAANNGYAPQVRRREPQTLEEVLNRLPPEAQQLLANAQAIELREKDKIISELLANAGINDEQEKTAQRERLLRRSLPELENDLRLMPKQRPEDLATVMNKAQRPRHRGEEVLVPPSSDQLWAEVTDNEASDEDGDTSFDDDRGSDDLTKLSPKQRKLIENAMLVEQREKNRLIEEIVANLDDSIDEAMHVAKLQAKSLEELQDMLAFIPKRKSPAVNYFSATPVLSGRFTQAKEDDDLLLPPSSGWGDLNGDGQ